MDWMNEWLPDNWTGCSTSSKGFRGIKSIITFLGIIITPTMNVVVVMIYFITNHQCLCNRQDQTLKKGCHW